jgi:hypothetical protein
MEKDTNPQEQKPQESPKKEELKEVETKHIKKDENFLKAIKKIAGR